MGDEEPLIRLVDEGRLGQSTESRGRERMLRNVAEEGASLVGTLLDLAERESVVTVRTDAGRSHHGVLAVVGADFCVIRSDGGQRTYLRTDAVAVVRPHRRERHLAASGDREPPVDLLLADVLAMVAPERPRVLLVTSGSGTVAGELLAAGTDVVTVRSDGDARSVCYVAVGRITEATLEAG